MIKNYPYKYRDFSRIAALASLAAKDQGKYWEMHDMLISRSPKLDQQSLLSYAEELGLDMQKFTDALTSGKHTEEVEQDVQLAESIDLYNTPTFYINGVQVVGERPFDYFKKIIDAQLVGAKK